MELTVDQALQQGVAAHSEGKLQDAERLYRAILQTQPNHPDANHNLGVLAVAVDKPLEAIPLFKLALEANPQVEQFWLSYIDSLIKLERFDEAERVLAGGGKPVVSSQNSNFLQQQIQTAQYKDKKNIRPGLTVSEKRKRRAEKKKSKQRKAVSESSDTSPSQDQFNYLLGHFQAGRFAEAESVSVSLTQQFPNHPFAWKVLGATLNQRGKQKQSLIPLQKSVALSPKDAEAHNNLGNTLQELRRLEEAEASYIQAIVLKSDYAEAHYNLGITLRELGRIDEAEASYRQAIVLKSDYVEAHINLGVTLQDLGRLEEAEVSFINAIALNSDIAEAYFGLGNTLRDLGRIEEAFSSYALAVKLKPGYNTAYVAFGSALQNMRFTQANPSLYPVLSDLLTTGSFVRPSNVAPAIVSLLKHDPVIADLLARAKTSIIEVKDVAPTIAALHRLPLLHHLMRICPLPDLQLEGLFVAIRRLLLTNLQEIETSPELIHFLATLSLQCFTNEYIYLETAKETELAEALQVQIAQCFARSMQPSLLETLCLACYRPLHCYDWLDDLRVTDHLPEVKGRLIDEPVAERLLLPSIRVLADVEDEVSRKVQEHYEEHPYPRWVKLSIPLKSQSITKICEAAELKLGSDDILDVSNPSILIAGCGTGQHSIGSACLYSNCRVTAVDLSLASLAYAQRKTIEHGISNIEYLQADILKLGQLNLTFDIIESAGVLHHMEDPMAGWRVLTELLNVGGLMKIGLYSELARRHIVAVREEIASLGLGPSETSISAFRQSLLKSPHENHRLLVTSTDFFSLSTIRDLIFHEQECRFTLPRINDCLNRLGLKFCGFANADIVSRFRAFHGERSEATDLMLWNEFEESHSQTFLGMYEFWCQKL